MNTFYAVKIDDDIKFIIPWDEDATIPSLIDVAQTCPTSGVLLGLI